jgi:hypothetical protein
MTKETYWQVVRKVTKILFCGCRSERGTHYSLGQDAFPEDVSADSTSPLLVSQEASNRRSFYFHDAHEANLLNYATESSSLTIDSVSCQVSIDQGNEGRLLHGSPPKFALELDNANLRREFSRLRGKNKELEEESTIRTQELEDQSLAIQGNMHDICTMKEERGFWQAESQSFQHTIKNLAAGVDDLTDQANAVRRRHREAIRHLEDENSTMLHQLRACQEALADAQRSCHAVHQFWRHRVSPLASLITNLIRQTPVQKARAVVGSLINHALTLTLLMRRFWHSAARDIQWFR